MKKFTPAEVFFVITGFSIPEKVLGAKKPIIYREILVYMVGSCFYDHQLERIRQECKIALLKQYPELLLWDLGIEICQRKNAIEKFYKKFIKKEYSFFKIEPMPSEIHLVINPMDELEIVEKRNKLVEKI